MKKNILLKFVTISIIAYLSCSNPTDDDSEQKERVRILVDQTLTESGRYVFFWDGKDDNKQYVSPGKYLYSMQTKTYDQISYMTAEPGGKTAANNEEHFEPGFWNSFELEVAYPEPFNIQSGVNIPFLVSEPARVKIMIFKD